MFSGDRLVNQLARDITTLNRTDAGLCALGCDRRHIYWIAVKKAI